MCHNFLQVTVRETDTAERRSSTVTLTVSVLDVNDNDPTVPSSLLNVTVQEGDYSSGGQVLTKVSFVSSTLHRKEVFLLLKTWSVSHSHQLKAVPVMFCVS